MSLKELGEKLREERERQGLSIEEVQERSKIAPNVLKAIEEGREDILPHPVYVKGFLKTYISVLGMDIDDPELGLDTIFNGVEPPRSSVRRHKPLTEVTPYPMQREHKRSNKLLILFVLLLLAAGGGYFIWQSLKSAQPPAPVEDNATSEGEAAETPASAQSNSSAGETLPERAVIPESEAPQLPVPANATAASVAGANATNSTEGEPVESEIDNIARTIESSVDEAENGTEGVSRDQSAPLNATEAVGDDLDAEKLALFEQAVDSEPVSVHAPAGGGDQSVQIMAMEPCWIGFTIDQDAPKDFYLYAGQRAIVEFDKTLLLRLGNAGGVRFFYNDEPFPTEYSSGEVKELRFPPTPE